MKHKVFSSNFDIRKNAYMNWRTDKDDIARNFLTLGSGFKEAANILINDILIDNSSKQADILVFPILYSINQSIELYIKAILYNLKTIKPNRFIDIYGHDIRELFDDMIYQIENIEGTLNDFYNAVESLVSYIKELYSFIETEDGKLQMEFARYPVNRNNDPYFYIAQYENVVVDVENLLTWYDGIMDSLEGIYLKYEHEMEENNDTTNRG